MDQSTALRTLLFLLAGLIFLLIGFTGKLGSVFGAVIDPANMTGGGSTGNGALSFGSSGSNQLSDSQLAQVAGQYFTGQSLQIAIAVALAESGGVVNALNTSNADGSTDRGLWQINSVHSQYDPNRLLSDPSYNAAAAYAISSYGTNWAPWTTYQTGAYLQYMSRAAIATGMSV